ncbi:MAG: tetratricopeptide repeat protein [Xenococcaceae cyanobacterium]
MKESQQKRSRWLYVVLVLMLVALIGFSLLPILSSITQANQSRTRTASAPTSDIPLEKQAQLETEAKGYELVLEREPDNETALQGLLEARLKQGNIKGAINPLERLAKLHPQQTDYTILLAQAKQQLSDFEGAAAAYRTILVDHPGDIMALQGMVNLLLQQNRPEAAIGLLQDTLKNAPEANSEQSDSVDVTSVQLLLGQIYVSQKRYGEAIAVYDQAFETDKQDFRPVLAKALVLQEQGKDAEAKPLFDTAISLAPARYKDQIKEMATKKPEPESTSED